MARAGGLHEPVVEIRHPRLSAVHPGDLQLHGLRRHLGHVVLEELGDLVGLPDSGTSRMLTLAIATAGMTVLAPSPVNPLSSPLTSNVGRPQTRSRVV